MSGPWEKYQTAPQAESGPWTQYQSAPKAEKVASPTDGNSFLDNLRAGVGGAIVDFGLGLKQRYLEAAQTAGKKTGISDEFDRNVLGTTATDELKKAQAAVDEKRRIDAPLMTTAGGKIGSFGTKMLPAIAATFIPGGQTLAGSIIAGAVTGAIEPTATGESALLNTATGAAGGAAGYGVGKGVAYGANRLTERAATKAASRAGVDAVATNAKEAGLVIPPSQTNPTITNRVLEGLAGKVSTAQAASAKNQGVINRMAANSLGLDPEVPITKEALTTVRKEAGRAYEALRGAGNIAADAQYAKDLAAVTQKFQGAAKDFPELAKTDVADIVASVNKPSFSADSAIDAIGILRDKAGDAFGKGDKTLGNVYRSLSDAMESAIDRNLAASGSKDLLNSYRAARQTIAKTYSVEKSLDQATGNIQARVLKTQLEKGRPLSGELKTIAETAQAFPKAVELPKSSTLPFSPLDAYATAGLGAAGAYADNPWIAALPLARVGARSAMLSNAFQRTLGTPSYGGNAIMQALASDPVRMPLPGVGAVVLPQLLEK